MLYWRWKHTYLYNFYNSCIARSKKKNDLKTGTLYTKIKLTLIKGYRKVYSFKEFRIVKNFERCRI